MELFLDLTRVALRAMAGAGGSEKPVEAAVAAECARRMARLEAARVATSFMLRWSAIGRARQRGTLDEFINPSDGGVEIVHTAVFQVAAVCPLAPDGDFDDSFVSRVRAIIASEETE